ncbi:sodium:solute symporter family protein [bacterium]|nr:sodium:solute symporter family protein [bacterium]
MTTGLSNISPLDLFFPALFIGALLAVGFVRSGKRNDTEEFLLMGRSLSAPAFVMSLVTSWYGGILGVSEYSYSYGLSNWFVFGLPYYLHAVIFALFLAKRARRSRLYSIPDKLRQAYGNSPARVGALVIFLTTMPAAYLLMLGKLTSWMFGWSYPIALLAGVLFSTLYIYTGGLRSIVRTDILQFAVMYGGFAIMVIVLFTNFGGIEFLRAHVKPELFTPTGGQGFAAIFVWYIIAATTLIEPVFYERVYASKSEKQVLPGILISIGFWAIFDFMTTATGLYARAIIGDISDPAFAFPELAARVLPAGLFGLFLAALLATIMSTIDSYSFIAAGALGRDLLTKPAEQQIQSPRKVRLALIATTVCACLLALASDSIVSLWHGLGSVAAPVLLIPTLSAWSTKASFSRTLVLPAMLTSGIVALLWRLSTFWTISGEYWLGVEPIYIGIGISLSFYLLGKITK